MNDELKAEIRRFGLTEKEADTYLMILENGPVTVNEIATEANISKRHVYNVAKKLEDRYFVIVNDYFNPTTIEAEPPEEVLNTLYEQADKLYQHLHEKYQTRAGDVNSIKVLKSRSTVINTIVELIDSAEKLLALSLPVSIIPIVRDELADAIDRGVVVLSLIFEGQTNSQSLSEISLDRVGHVVRYRDAERTIMLAADGESALVSSRGVITEPNSQVDAIFLGLPYLETVVFTSLINTEWVNAEELYVVNPYELPRTYTTFRRAAIDAAVYMNDGVELTAEIEARPTDQPDLVVELIGEVDAVKQRLVQPTTDPLPGLCSLHLRTDDGVVNVGGDDATIEEYRSFTITLDRKE